ncbi:cysteine hydrolase [Curtobacterium sp. VKM Ac-2922]|uniref:cysteine hydrolase family protein n=1 Tax=Curtobacterium sp. VKM Ac-2922 TaxID=2929475 RepID=UPI0027E31B37|nr:cysteine hydrolase [Curtobacterium sp. VKM Ac-2922]
MSADHGMPPTTTGAPLDATDAPLDTTGAWLVVIDMQHVFTGDSPWSTPGYDRAAAAIERLLCRFPDRVVRTRFVAPEHPTGAWVDYYREWPFALVPADDPVYDLTEPLAALDGPVVTATSFGKWGSSLQAVVGEHPHLVLAGVSTDCCVLSTALAAADAGVRVTVVADACAGASDADHARALDAMRLYAPLVTVVDTL